LEVLLRKIVIIEPQLQPHPPAALGSRFFDIAIGSIAESAMAIEIMKAYGATDEQELTKISESLRIAYAMTIRLKRSTAR
jgi:hypothetical protein